MGSSLIVRGTGLMNIGDLYDILDLAINMSLPTR